MQPFSIQKNSFLLLLGGLALVSASLVYLFTSGNTLSKQHTSTTPTAKILYMPVEEVMQSRPPTCAAKQRDFQMGVAFPQWTPTAYGESDKKWLTELPNMRTQTAACWVEMPILFSQSSLSSTTIEPEISTPSVLSFSYGVHLAHALGLHVFVTPLIDVQGPQSWAGSIHFATYEQQQQWFDSYWQVIKPYAVAAAQAGIEQFAIGTEEEWLQTNAPDALWNGLIANVRSVFAGTLTYDMNWTSTQLQLRSWMHNPDLKMIGVSAYFPVIDTPQWVDPQQISALWAQKVKSVLDTFASELGKPIFISEIGYRNSADTLYHPWESTSSAPPAPEEQAAAYNAVLTNTITDQNILGIFFWGWDDTGAFNLNGLQAVTVIHTHYEALEA